MKSFVISFKLTPSMEKAASDAVDGASTDFYEDMMLDDEAETKLMGSIPDSLANVPSDCYPSVVTYRKFLTILDGSVLELFFDSSRFGTRFDSKAIRLNFDGFRWFTLTVIASTS